VKFLSFLNLLDQEGKLSITNTAMYVIIGKVVSSPFEWSSAITLFIVCANYMHKRVAVNAPPVDTSKVDELIASTTTSIEDLKSTVTGLALKVGMK
jgi:hypothetical protein